MSLAEEIYGKPQSRESVIKQITEDGFILTFEKGNEAYYKRPPDLSDGADIWIFHKSEAAYFKKGRLCPEKVIKLEANNE